MTQHKIKTVTFSWCLVRFTGEYGALTLREGGRLWEHFEDGTLRFFVGNCDEQSIDQIDQIDPRDGDNSLRICNCLLLTDDGERAGAERFADVVEHFARVRAGVFGEDFGDAQSAVVGAALVLKVLARLDLLLIVQPDDVELGGGGDGALQRDRLAVVHQTRRHVLDDPRRAVLARRFAASAGQIIPTRKRQ